MTTKIKLPQVTLVCVTSVDEEAHMEALRYSSKDIEFGQVKLIDLDTHTIDDWNKAVVYDLGEQIYTDYALLIHSDGFVVNPYSWKDEWLKYDYIGSPWPLPSPTDMVTYRDVLGHLRRVGNSVGLRSKRLLDLPKKLNLEWKPYHGFYNEDGFIAVNNAHIFEEQGMKFAPFDVALEFGRETPLPENKGIKPFVFHRYAGENKDYPRFGTVRNETPA